MSSHQQPECTHDRGPGTTVCFRCRYESGVASRERLRKGAVWGSVIVIAIAALAAGGNAGMSWLELVRDDGEPTLQAATPPAPVANDRSAGWAAESVRMVALTPPAPPTNAPTVRGPILLPGTTAFPDEIMAVRRGDTVFVSFDTPQARTRRADKFDALLRSTLPRIYGGLADTLLAANPGKLVSDARTLVRELPAKGLTVAGKGDWRIVVWPETRLGQDGPLVVRYRTALAH